jgi:hypothetical protein
MDELRDREKEKAYNAVRKKNKKEKRGKKYEASTETLIAAM